MPQYNEVGCHLNCRNIGKTISKDDARSLGYIAVRQRGSHITMRLETNIGAHSITVPNHEEIAKGTLDDILNKVSI